MNFQRKSSWHRSLVTLMQLGHVELEHFSFQQIATMLFHMRKYRGQAHNSTILLLSCAG